MPKLRDFPLAKRLTSNFADMFREAVSGHKDGKPDWVKSIETGDAGLFKEDGAVWQVHGSAATLVGGIRALLLQAAHPAPLSGVAQHSRYESDPLGRLAGTTRWLTITTFGSTQAIAREAERVNKMHAGVSGEYTKKDGAHANYRAADPRFLLWVHCAFTDSFLKCHQSLGYAITDGADEYVKDWALSAVRLGLESAPQSVAELESCLDDFRRNDLAHSAPTNEVVRFILNPPFGRAAMIFYRVLSNAAICTLHDNELAILELKRPNKIWLKIARGMLNVFTALLGSESPSQHVARERLAGLRNSASAASSSDVEMETDVSESESINS